MTPIPVDVGPSSADWLSAWSTLGAAIGTVGTLALGLILWRSDRRRDRRDQAKRIHAYATRYSSTVDGPHVHYVIQNNSDSPIYDVWLPRHEGGPGIPSHFTMIPGGAEETLEPTNEEKEAYGATTTKDIPIFFEFRDAASTCWYRDSDGRLHQKTRRQLQRS
jgi:hypothetical protein